MSQIISNNMKAYNNALDHYASGQLSPAKHMMIDCLKKVSPAVSGRMHFEEKAGVCELEESSPETLSPVFIANVVADLPPQDDFVNDNKTALDIDGAIQNVRWNKFIPLVSIHNIIGSRKTVGKERLYLFRAKPGAKLPEHSHRGEEWVLVLKGCYTADGKIYNRGDLHIVNENDTHSLEIGNDEECICLAMTEAKVQMNGIIPRIVQNVLGI